VEQVPLESGARLVQVSGTLEQVVSMADQLEGAFVKVLLDEKARAGLNEQVRAVIPGAVDVIVSRPDDDIPHQRVSRAGRTPAELLATYLSAKGFDDPEVIDLFRELEQEVLA
jgi:exonuclease SbcD